MNKSPADARIGRIILNSYSTQDTCDRCAMTLFLELCQYNSNSKARRDRSDKAVVGKNSVGVFEKFNNIRYGRMEKERGKEQTLPEAARFGVLISSNDPYESQVHTTNVFNRRLHLGHNGRGEDPIDLSSFPPWSLFTSPHPQRSQPA